MVRGLYTAYTGMNAQQQRMDTISNNLANVNTTGFKKDGVFFESFKDQYIRKINDPETAGGERIGSMNFGVKVGETYVDFAQGALQQTNIQNQIAIHGEGFLNVGVPNGEEEMAIKFTRDGSLHLNSNGELMTASGHYVLDENLDKIVITDMGQLMINEQGGIYQDTELIANLKITNFEDPQLLNKLGNSLYDATTETVEKPFEGKIMQGYIENSNVSSIDEMINMINVMRTYESSQKVLTTYDGTLDQAVNQIGRV